MSFDSLNLDLSAGAMPPAPVVQQYPAPAPRPDEMLRPDFPPAAVQGNIVTTRAEAPKRPAGIAQGQINPMLVASRPPTSSNPLEESSTIVQKPTDKPINLDMNAFLGDTQKTKKDIDIINEVR